MKFLFCDNSKAEIKIKASNSLDYVGRPLDSLATLNGTQVGLENWFLFEKNFDFSSFDLIWIYLDHRSLIPNWYSWPEVIKTRAKDSKVIFTVDYEGLFVEKQIISPRILNAWKSADAMHVITKLGHDFFTKVLSIPIYYTHVGRPQFGNWKWPKPMDFNSRNGVVFVRHTNLPSIIFELELIRDLNLKAIGIDSNPDAKGWLEQQAQCLRVEGQFFNRLDFNQYLKISNLARLGIENHLGPSRFSYEMALMDLPVVHSEKSEYGNIIWPKLTAKSGNKRSFREKIKLLNDKTFYRRVINQAEEICFNYFSPPACEERLSKLIENIMGKNKI